MTKLPAFRVERRGRLCRDRLFARSSLLLERGDVSRIATSMSRNCLSSALLLTGWPCPAMMIVSVVVAARLASDAAIIPSMLPPVE